MADVAQEAGVSPSTVSRALRNDPRISAETRERVGVIVERLGYLPNPMVSTLMAARRTGVEATGMSTIALITDYGGEKTWREKDVCRWEFDGMRRRASELGFRLEEFPMAEHGGKIERLEEVLKRPRDPWGDPGLLSSAEPPDADLIRGFFSRGAECVFS